MVYGFMHCEGGVKYQVPSLHLILFVFKLINTRPLIKGRLKGRSPFKAMHSPHDRNICPYHGEGDKGGEVVK